MSFAIANTRSDVPTLLMKDVRFPAPDARTGDLVIDLNALPGELIIVSGVDAQHAQVIVDAACGLRPPDRGTVFFQGRDWRGTPPDHANARRGRIGSALGDGAWLPYLSMPDNILLPTLYHTRRTREDLFSEAVHLAEGFGLLGLPTRLPGNCSGFERRCSAIIRAFLGGPALILVGPWAEDFDSAVLGPLVNAMRRSRDAGAAVVWLVPDERRELDVALFGARRYALTGNRLMKEGVP